MICLLLATTSKGLWFVMEQTNETGTYAYCMEGETMKHKIKLCNSLGCEESMQKKDFTVTGFLSNFEAGVTFTFRGTDSEFSKWFDGENLRELEEVEISTETLT